MARNCLKFNRPIKKATGRCCTALKSRKNRLDTPKKRNFIRVPEQVSSSAVDEASLSLKRPRQHWRMRSSLVRPYRKEKKNRTPITITTFLFWNFKTGADWGGNNKLPKREAPKWRMRSSHIDPCPAERKKGPRCWGTHLVVVLFAHGAGGKVGQRRTFGGDVADLRVPLAQEIQRRPRFDGQPRPAQPVQFIQHCEINTTTIGISIYRWLFQ